jgi:hypothetical protein
MFNEYALETKSYHPSSNEFYSFYDNYTGEVIGGVQRLSLSAEIQKNFAIQTVISNQLGIINNCELQALKRDENKTESATNYKPALDFLDILNNPNSNPAPRHWNDIIEGIYHAYISNGIVAIILCNGVSKSIQNIEVATSVQYINRNNMISYNISTIGTHYQATREFVKNEELGVFVNGNDIAIIFGNFDYYTKTYQSPLTHIQDVILWQNYIIRSSRVFYENSCRPSSIITVKFLDEKGKISTSDNKDEPEKMQKIMSNIAAQLKGTNNNGKVFIASHPNIEIDVKPISVVQNANDIKEQLALTKQIIYSTFTGANTNVIEGVSEYSNNRIASLREFYDGTISTFNRVILNELNAFLVKWLKPNSGTSKDAIERKGIYLSFDISKIKFYNDLEKQEILMALEKQMIKRQEGRTKFAKLDDTYADLEILGAEDDGFVGEKKPNTL